MNKVFQRTWIALGICLAGSIGCGGGLKASSGGTTQSSSTLGTGSTPAPQGQTPSNTQDTSPPGPVSTVPAKNCGLQLASSNLAFCETFDKPSSIFNRSGQLDGLVWGVSRQLSSVNIGQPWPWATTELDVCGKIQTVNSPNDVQICNGRLVEATNDDHSVSALAMYPKQQFDFSGRTGTVAFDVTNNTAGTHASWPEFWISDQPVPVPFNHFGSWVSVPANGLGVRFGANAMPNEYGICPNVGGTPRFTVDSAVIVRDWHYEDAHSLGGSQCMDDNFGLSCVETGTKVNVKGCVTQASGPNGGMNHIELKVAQNLIEVYATDAGTTAPLKLIATIEKANLSLSRGFVWMIDAHYNASKGPDGIPIQTMHTFSWDNVAFDGPLIARERSFDVLESKTPMEYGQYLGWNAFPDDPAVLKTISIPAADIVAAKTGALLFNFYHYDAPSTFTYKINGKSHTVAWPFPDKQGYTARTISLPVPLNELVMGANDLTIYADKAMATSNVSISLQGAGGIVAPK